MRKWPTVLIRRFENAKKELTGGSYFCNPNFKSYIEAIPGTYTSETERKYEGINSGKYLVQRLAATY